MKYHEGIASQPKLQLEESKLSISKLQTKNTFTLSKLNLLPHLAPLQLSEDIGHFLFTFVTVKH